MNEPEPLDELASAHVDGISTSDDPTVLARARQFEQVRAAMKAVEPADEGRRDRIIVSAMDAAVVIPIRPRRYPIAASAGIVTAAAAALVAIAFGLSHGSSDTKTAAEASHATTAAPTSDASRGALDSAKQSPPSTSAALPAGDGVYSTAAAASTTAAMPIQPIVISFASELPDVYKKSTTNAPLPVTAPAGSCATEGTFVAAVTYDTKAAELWVRGSGANRTLVVVATGTCQQLAEAPLP